MPPPARDVQRRLVVVHAADVDSRAGGEQHPHDGHDGHAGHDGHDPHDGHASQVERRDARDGVPLVQAEEEVHDEVAEEVAEEVHGEVAEEELLTILCR